MGSLAEIAAEQGQMEVLEWLLASSGKSRLAGCYRDGATLLHFASGAATERVVTWVLEHILSDVQKRDASGATALHWAAIRGDPAVLETLVAAGGQIDVA